MQEYDYSERNDELFEELEQLEWCLQEIEWVQCHTKRDHLGPVCWEK